MAKHPLDVERLIGWISFALGISALQENDSTFYRVASTTVPLAWVGTYCLVGIALVLSTYTDTVRCRIVLLCLLLLTWAGGLGLVVASGPLGAYGAVAIVMISFIISILFTKVRSEAEAEYP